MPHRPGGQARPIEVNKLNEVRRKPERVERPRNHVGKRQHPSHEEGGRPRKHLPHKHIPASAFRDGARKLRVRDAGEHRHDPVERKDQDGRRASNLRGQPREDENAGPDHCPHADHGGVEEAEARGWRSISWLGHKPSLFSDRDASTQR